MNRRSRLSKQHPAVLVLLSFLLVILLGSGLLFLPVSLVSGHISFLDALFTAASAVCVTGLIVVDTGSYFTTFGQVVIILLIQIGGLGVMTISVAMFRWLRRSISFRHRMVMQDLFSHTPREDIFSLVKSVVVFALLIEGIGAILLVVHWSRYLSIEKAVYVSIFHAVSAFCNAGFSLYSDSMMAYDSSILLNTVMGLLIIFGGLGFPVLYEIQDRIRSRTTQTRLSIQTKTVFHTTGVMIAFGAVLFGLLEYSSGNGEYSWLKIMLTSLFQSITARTAGFNTVDISSISDAAAAMMLFLMFIGASPGSCGGGIKTTTLALLAASSISRIRGWHRVNLYKKSIPNDTVTRGLTLIVISIGIIGLFFFLILSTNQGNGSEILQQRGAFLPYLFETVSAFGTVGLSMGITSSLNSWGKVLIILMMIIGRVGVLTFSYIITGNTVSNGVEYSEENLMIG